MVRSDDGSSKEFLASPSNISFTSLSSGFDPNVDTIVMIHGFLNNFEDCKGAYTAAMNTLKPIIGKRNYVGFHWPSKVLWFGTGVENANKAAPYLAHVLVNITKWYGGNGHRIHFLTHSLGGRVILNTLEDVSARNVAWGQCYTMATAVHNDAFQNSFAGANEIPQKFYAFHSEGDYVLKYIYSLYYFLFGKGDRRASSPEIEAFMNLSFEEQIAYLQKLDESLQNNMKFANELSELDTELAEALERGKSAMGLYGSEPAYKVENVNMSDIISSHTYWENQQAITRVAGKMK